MRRGSSDTVSSFLFGSRRRSSYVAMTMEQRESVARHHHPSLPHVAPSHQNNGRSFTKFFVSLLSSSKLTSRGGFCFKND